MPKEHGSKVFELLEVDNQGGIMQHRPVLHPPELVQVPLSELKKWRVSRQAMPATGSPDIVAKGLPSSHCFGEGDFQKAQVITALHECYQAHSEEDLEVLAMATNPQGLFAKKTIAVKKLKLVPLGPISKVKTSQGKAPKLTIQAFCKLEAPPVPGRRHHRAILLVQGCR